MKKKFNFKFLMVFLIMSTVVLGSMGFADTFEHGRGYHHWDYDGDGERYADGGYCYEEDFSDQDAISEDEALKQAEEYVDKLDGEFSITGDGIELYRHYRFNLEKDNEDYGFISVDKYNGEVWNNYGRRRCR